MNSISVHSLIHEQMLIISVAIASQDILYNISEFLWIQGKTRYV